MAVLERVPFDIAISDPKLLKKHFDTLSTPQQVVLKAFNGLPLNEIELRYWSMLQGGCEFDELGFPRWDTLRDIPYRAQKYHTLDAILGRRSGKTDRITATQFAYEATMGGHMQHVEPGQSVKMLFIAQDIDMAKSHLNFIYNAIQSSPLLARECEKFNADAIKMRNGLTIEPAPPTITSSRGMAVPGWCGDEVGFWYTDPKAANPDYEVERAVEYAMAQFPDAFKIITSTPYTKEGMLYKAHLAGTNGCKLAEPEDRVEFQGVLVVHAPTAAMENPRIDKKRLVRLQKKDPEAFIRESLAKFVDSISGFLTPERLRAAIDSKVLERPPAESGFYYIAAMDPAFRHDKFAFTICHHDRDRGIVQDYFEEWTPELGSPLNPSVILTEIKAVLDRYHISLVYSDQYQLESLQQLALNLNFTIVGIDFTAASKAKIYGSLASLVNQGRLRLLDKSTIYDQLVALEKRRTPGGQIQISAPPGKYDDAAAACALCVNQCVWLLPVLVEAKPLIPTHVEDGWACIQRKRAMIANGDGDDDISDISALAA